MNSPVTGFHDRTVLFPAKLPENHVGGVAGSCLTSESGRLVMGCAGSWVPSGTWEGSEASSIMADTHHVQQNWPGSRTMLDS